MKREAFVKTSPSGNMTILVRNGALSADERAGVAREVMSPEHLGAEQVGFVDTTKIPPRMDMMGGEFCVNATRAFAALLLEDGLLHKQPDGWHWGTVSVSGMDRPVTVRARKTGELCEAQALIELIEAPAVRCLSEGIHAVSIPGITHLVLEKGLHPLPRHWEEETAALRGRFGLQREEAVGCIWLDTEGGLNRITPYVWVRDSDTSCAETACGSGTLAAVIYLWNAAGKRRTVSVLQPGGELLTVAPLDSGTSWCAWVGGNVHVIAEGWVYVHCLS